MGVIFFFMNDKNEGISNELELQCFCRPLENQRVSCSKLSPSSIDTDKRRNVTMPDKHRNAATLCAQLRHTPLP